MTDAGEEQCGCLGKVSPVERTASAKAQVEAHKRGQRREKRGRDGKLPGGWIPRALSALERLGLSAEGDGESSVMWGL